MNLKDNGDARSNFEKKKNKPMYEDGMGDTEDDVFSSLFDNIGTDGGFDNKDTLTNDLGFNNLNNGFSLEDELRKGNPNNNQTPIETKKSGEDLFYELAIKGSKGIFSGFKIIYKIYKNLTYEQLGNYFSRMVIISIAIIPVGIICRMLGFRLFGIEIYKLIGTQLIATSFAATGVLRCGKQKERGKERGNLTENAAVTNYSDDIYNEDDEDNIFDFDESDTDEDVVTKVDNGFDITKNSLGNTDNSDNSFDSFLEEMERRKGKSKENSMEKLEKKLGAAVNDRGFLYSLYKEFFVTITPNYKELQPISPDGSFFPVLDERCTKAINATMNKDIDEYDNTILDRAEENAFYYRCFMKRIKGVNKLDDIQKELSVYLSDDPDKKADVSVGIWQDFYDIKVLKEYDDKNPLLISYGDLLRQKEVEELILDPKNKYPVILGILENGDILFRDMKSIESGLVAGLGRSGKTWWLEFLFGQLAAFASPSELQFIVCDTKANLSDWNHFKIPHLIAFEGGVSPSGKLDYTRIIRLLNVICNGEALRRKTLIGDHGCTNIWQFKEKYPNINMPMIYVIVDELVALADALNESREELNSLIRRIVMEFPATGIRLYCVPHVAKNQFLSKSAKDVMHLKASVRGDLEHIKSTLSINKFPKRLKNVGDIALALAGQEPVYIKSPVLTNKENDLSKIFEFITKVWDSVGYEFTHSRDIQKIIDGDY